MRIQNLLVLAALVSFAANTGLGQTNYYVDLSNGSDSWNGLAPVHTHGSTGPKRTIQSVVTTAGFADIISITDGDHLRSNTHPLPIQLASFTATVSKGHDVTLNWITVSETNNYGFYVQQRASSSSQFIDMPNGIVPGHGTTLGPQTYSWSQTCVAYDTYSYRLKQVDLDGSINYSDPTGVTVSSPTGDSELQSPVTFNLAQNYPNPFNPSTQILFTVDKQGLTTLAVFDILGMEVETLYTGDAEPGRFYSVSFDASRLTNGTYFYKLVNGSKQSIRKMLLLK